MCVVVHFWRTKFGELLETLHPWLFAHDAMQAVKKQCDEKLNHVLIILINFYESHSYLSTTRFSIVSADNDKTAPVNEGR